MQASFVRIGVALLVVCALFEAVAIYKYAGHYSVDAQIANDMQSIYDRLEKRYGSRGNVVRSGSEIWWHSNQPGNDSPLVQLLKEERELTDLERLRDENKSGLLLWRPLAIAGFLPLLMGAGALVTLRVSKM